MKQTNEEKEKETEKAYLGRPAQHVKRVGGTYFAPAMAGVRNSAY
jgi:hypothetical protein